MISRRASIFVVAASAATHLNHARYPAPSAGLDSDARLRARRRAMRARSSSPDYSTANSRLMKPIDFVPVIRSSTFAVYLPGGNSKGSRKVT